MLQWEKPEDWGGGIQRYQIQILGGTPDYPAAVEWPPNDGTKNMYTGQPYNTATSIIDNGLRPAQFRSYRVQACMDWNIDLGISMDHGCGPWSDPPFNASTLASAPTVNGDVVNTAIGQYELSFSWPDAAPNGYFVTEYRVEMTTAGTPPDAGSWSGVVTSVGRLRRPRSGRLTRRAGGPP